MRSQRAEYDVNMTCVVSILRHVFEETSRNRRMRLMHVSMRFQGWRGFHKGAMVFGLEILEYELGRAAVHSAQGLGLEKGGSVL
jgi:hypothetical protein